jgi:hypothetical protein
MHPALHGVGYGGSISAPFASAGGFAQFTKPVGSASSGAQRTKKQNKPNHQLTTTTTASSCVDGNQRNEENSKELQTWFCEPCDKEFTQLSNYEAHCATHETCRHPGCTFNGTKKVVIAHYHGSHGLFSGSGYKMIEVEGGMKFRVLLGTSPEEVEKWRAERKNRFPTADNINQKQQQQDDLINAGGVVPKKGRKRDHQGVVTGGDPNSASGDGGENAPNRNNAAPGSRKKHCTFFARGMCKEGDNCRFSHDFEPKLCNAYTNNGRCSRGSRCPFMHDKVARENLQKDRVAGTESGRDDSAQCGDAVDATSTTHAREQSTTPTPPSSSTSRDPQSEPLRCRTNNADRMAGKKRRILTDDEARASTQKRKGALFLPKPLAGGTRGTLLKRLLQEQIEEEDNVVLQCIHLAYLRFTQGE